MNARPVTLKLITISLKIFLKDFHLLQCQHMACTVLCREHAESHFHQVVAAILLAVALKLRCLARHEVGLLHGVHLGWVEALQLHVHLRLLVAWVQVVGK